MVLYMRADMKEDLSSLLSAMLHTNTNVDMSRMLTQENMFDAAILRTMLLDFVEEEDSDAEEFFHDAKIDETFLRGFMAGLVQVLMIERGHGETIGRKPHAEVVALYDATRAFLMEDTI